MSEKVQAQEAMLLLKSIQGIAMPQKLDIDTFMQSLDEVGNKANFIEHLFSKNDAQERIALLNLVEPTLKTPDVMAEMTENKTLKQKFIKKFNDGKDFFYLLATKENGSVLLTGFKTNRLNTIERELQNADIIQTFIQQGSKQETNSRFGLPKKEVIVDGGDAHAPYTQAQSLDGRLVDNNISSTPKNNSTPNNSKSQATSETQSKPRLRKH